ncbi:hypothetical protein QLT00_gp80 [Gordonia phage Commandaria]|uniref:Uncharacterized protein n=1 Tax=Gordonia phage Commandaria TaxID=3038364 RepID=A0AAF0GGE2_9CAUD|nr:hypothetical protein QLT00_gp80 [Gordonia phage Commandaria]WGH20863.1 hypothetical protein [Gordonia phage Commandaria]
MTAAVLDGVRVASGPLPVTVESVGETVATLLAAGYVWQVVADHDDTGADRVRVVCHGRRVSRLFDRWQYPRADVWSAVGETGAALLSGAQRVTLTLTPAGPGAVAYRGRVPLPDGERHAVESAARYYAVRDLD